jgi:hypothetical protein
VFYGSLIGDAEKPPTGYLFSGYLVGAAVMIAGGLVEVFLGVKAEGQSLESIAQPLTAEDADTGSAGPSPTQPATA